MEHFAESDLDSATQLLDVLGYSRTALLFPGRQCLLPCVEEHQRHHRVVFGVMDEIALLKPRDALQHCRPFPEHGCDLLDGFLGNRG